MKNLITIIIILILILAAYSITPTPQLQGRFNQKVYREWIDKEVGRPAYNRWKLTQSLNEFEQDRIRRGE